MCRQAKLRTHAHRRFENQSEGKQLAQVVEAPKAFLQRIACDHLEAVEEGSKGEKYSLVCVDEFSGVLFAYPSSDKPQSSVESALKHFCRESQPIVASDRYSSILGAIRELGMHPESSPPGDKFHNPLAESAIKTVRQGTRSLLLQSGLSIKHWPKAMTCFSYQYSATTPPRLEKGGLRDRAGREVLEEGVEEADTPEWESKPSIPR